MTCLSLVGIQFVKAYNYRSDHRSALSRPFANRWLNLAILWEVGLLALIVTVPFLREIFLDGFRLTAVDLGGRARLELPDQAAGERADENLTRVDPDPQLDVGDRRLLSDEPPPDLLA